MSAASPNPSTAVAAHDPSDVREAVIGRRDHRRLGRRLDLFTSDELVGAGLPLWLPDGAVIRE
jgi:threonyl-tRNA synthetase